MCENNKLNEITRTKKVLLYRQTAEAKNMGNQLGQQGFYQAVPIIMQRLMIVGGGKTKPTINNDVIPQQLLLSTHSSIKGSIRVTNLPIHQEKIIWQPPIKLPYKRSNQPLDVGLSNHYSSIIKQYCQFPVDMILAHSVERSTVTLTTQDLHNLLTHGQPTNDNTLYLFLEFFCSFFNYTFLTEKLFTLLK
jgi:hypothetical protein